MSMHCGLGSSSFCSFLNVFFQINYIKDHVVRELFNPFSTIAVWAAVRFVISKSTATLDASVTPNDGKRSEDYSCAFLPLISDPGEDERNKLFQPMANELKQVLMRRKMRNAVNS